MNKKKLTKGEDEILCRVCSGIAEYLNIDVTLVRCGFILLTCLNGIGLLLYLVLALLMPNKE